MPHLPFFLFNAFFAPPSLFALVVPILVLDEHVKSDLRAPNKYKFHDYSHSYLSQLIPKSVLAAV